MGVGLVRGCRMSSIGGASRASRPPDSDGVMLRLAEWCCGGRSSQRTQRTVVPPQAPGRTRSASTPSGHYVAPCSTRS